MEQVSQDRVLLGEYADRYLKPISHRGAMKYMEFCRMLGAWESGGRAMANLGLPVRRVGHIRVVDRGEAAAWLTSHNGRAWLDNRLRSKRMTVDQYNAAVDFVEAFR